MRNDFSKHQVQSVETQYRVPYCSGTAIARPTSQMIITRLRSQRSISAPTGNEKIRYGPREAPRQCPLPQANSSTPVSAAEKLLTTPLNRGSKRPARSIAACSPGFSRAALHALWGLQRLCEGLTIRHYAARSPPLKLLDAKKRYVLDPVAGAKTVLCSSGRLGRLEG